MSNGKVTSTIDLSGLVFIVFLVLKLTHVIDWSWWWVTAPLWGGFGIAAVILILALVFYGACGIITAMIRWWNGEGSVK